MARGAQERGFATLWSGEHVVMVDESESRYPYSADGQIAVPADADWLDPLIGLSFAAAATRSLRLATGVLLLPEHNPVIVAKQAASLDLLSGGRLTLGIGAGWSAEEFAALGVPFTGRGRRMEEYVEAMRTLWRDDVASYEGTTVRFDRVRVNPRPVRDRRIPIVLGGNSDTALRRVVRYGDGWYGFNLTSPVTRSNDSRRWAGCARRRDVTATSFASPSRSRTRTRRTRRRSSRPGWMKSSSSPAHRSGSTR